MLLAPTHHHHVLAWTHRTVHIVVHVIVVIVVPRRRHATLLPVFVLALVLLLLGMVVARRRGTASWRGSPRLDHVGGDLVEGGDAVSELAEERWRQRVSRVRQGGRGRGRVSAPGGGGEDAVRQGNAIPKLRRGKAITRFCEEMEDGERVKASLEELGGRSRRCAELK